jgi:predicted P-loop ATPase
MISPENENVQSMEKFAEVYSNENSTTKRSRQHNQLHTANFGDQPISTEIVEKLLNEHNIEFQLKKKQGETIFELRQCPKNEQHFKKAWIKVHPSGNVTAGCHKESCKWGFPSFYSDLVGKWPPSSKGEWELSREQEELLGNSGLQWTTSKQGKDILVSNLSNVTALLSNENQQIWYDIFLRKIKYIDKESGAVANWDDGQTLRLTKDLQQFDGLQRISRDVVDQGVNLYALYKKRNELTDWLDSLHWDGEPRLDCWLKTYCGASDSEFTREAGRCWLLAAVARAYDAGCKFDHMLVLEGEQGIGKSSVFEILAGDWFDELGKFDGKDSAEKLAGVWILEISELAGLKKSDVETVKSFLTNRSDRYRPPYGRRVEEFPRTCVFGGTTNAHNYLSDSTGNRRFWPIHCKLINIQGLRENRSQLIAEAVQRYRQGESFLLSNEAQIEAKNAQEDRFACDAWEEQIFNYINLQKSVTMDEIWIHALKIDHRENWHRANCIRIGNIMKKLGWERRRPKIDGVRGYVYYPPEA